MQVAAFASSALMRLLAPPRCAACDESLERDVIFCPPCAETVVPPDGEALGDGGLAAAAYGGAVAASLVRFKFGGRSDLARPLSNLMLHALARDVWPCDLVVPIPLHSSRLRERGYNQAALLGRPVAKFLGRPFVARALARSRPTAPQTALGLAERAHNVEGAFVVRLPRLVRERRVLLVDDVRTTGATLSHARRALMEVGAKNVRFLAVAQA